MNHPAFRQVFLAEQARQLDRQARRAYAMDPRDDGVTRRDLPVSLRLCTVHDNLALERLAALEGRKVPIGSFVVAEVRGEVVAAQPLDGGLPLADPFYPTAYLLPLLRLRARQLETATGRRSFLIRRRSAVRGF